MFTLYKAWGALKVEHDKIRGTAYAGMWERSEIVREMNRLRV